MSGTKASRRPDILKTALGAVPVGTAAGAGFAVGGYAGIALGVTGVMAPVIAALVREWFWLRALRLPERNFDRVCRITSGSVAETERLMRLLNDAEGTVLAARTGHRPRDRRTR